MTSINIAIFVCSKIKEEISEYFAVITVKRLYKRLELKNLIYPGYVFPGLF